MQAIGETLREARLRRGVEIAEVSTHTKIRVKYLRALENEDFALLPGPAYARTFLRTYAEFLGLDPHVLVEEYRLRHEPGYVDEPIAPLAPGPSSHRGTRRRVPGGPMPPPATMVAVGAVGLLLVFLVIGLFSDEDAGEPNAPAQTAVDPSPAPDRRPPEPPADREPKPPREARPKRVDVSVRPAAPTYICVDDGQGNVLFEDTIESPERLHGKEIRLNLGNALSRVTANGEPAKFPSGPNPIGLAITPRGVEKIPDGDRPCQ